MNTALIPHPAFSPAAPVVTVREIMLACACLDLKATVMHQAEQITRLQERNRALTKVLHRTACSGAALPDVLAGIALLGLAPIAVLTSGVEACLWCLTGSLAGILWLAFVSLRAARSAGRITPRRRVHPAHIDEPADEARLVSATAATLNLERGSLESTDPASL